MSSWRDSKGTFDMIRHHGQGVGPRGKPDLLRVSHYLPGGAVQSAPALVDGMSWTLLRHEQGATRPDSTGQ